MTVMESNAANQGETKMEAQYGERGQLLDITEAQYSMGDVVKGSYYEAGQGDNLAFAVNRWPSAPAYLTESFLVCDFFNYEKAKAYAIWLNEKANAAFKAGEC